MFPSHDPYAHNYKKLVYYNYADRDLKDAITACAIKSSNGMPNNMFKVYPPVRAIDLQAYAESYLKQWKQLIIFSVQLQELEF